MTPAWVATAQQMSIPALAISAVVLALVQAIKVWPQLRQMQITGDASMRSELMDRIGTLETRVADLEKLLTKKEASHAAREQFLRHQLANEAAALDAALSMLTISPDRIEAIIHEVMAMREAGRQRIALEKGAAAGAAVMAAGGEI